jgi:hypothetical protein
MTKGKQIIRMNDPEAKRQLNVLAAREGKTQGEIIARIIKQEYSGVFSVPREDVSISDVLKAVEE